MLSLFGSSAGGQCGEQKPMVRLSLHFVRQGFDIRKRVIYPAQALVGYVSAQDEWDAYPYQYRFQLGPSVLGICSKSLFRRL